MKYAYIIHRFFWCSLRWIRNDRTDDGLSDLLYRCIDLIENCPSVEVDIKQHYITIKTSSSNIRLWNENKFYAWLSSGSVNGRFFNFIMPSRKSSFDFKECLRRHGYNIYVKDPTTIVTISDVKC